MGLRDYQEEFITKVGEARLRGVTRMLAVSPTGSGKAVMLSHLPHPNCLNLQRGQQVIVLVHKIELCDQLADSCQRYNPGLKVGIERERFSADSDCDIVVASVQTIGIPKKGALDPEDDYSDRLRQFDKSRCRALIVDEIHHAPGKTTTTYMRILRYFNALKGRPNNDPSKLVFGFTATPQRSDNIGLEMIVDEIVYQKDILTMMRSGLQVDGKLRTWLSDVRSYRIATSVDISDVTVTKGDFSIKQLENAVNTGARNKLIVDNYLEHGEGQPFFAFTVDIQHSDDLAKAFQDSGVKAYAISGATPMQQRRALQDGFRRGEIRGLVSCGVLSEGVDIPSVGCLLMCRPTKSGLLYRQQVGRGLRPFPAPEELYKVWRRREPMPYIKPHCVVLDFMDMSGKHSLNSVPSILGLRPQFDMKGKKALEVVEDMEKLKAAKPGINLSLYPDTDALKSVAEAVDLFVVPQVSPEARKYSQFSWMTGLAVDTYELNLPEAGALLIKQNTLGQFEIFSSKSGVRRLLATADSMPEAFKLGDKSVPREAQVLLNYDATWRGDKPTEKQMLALAKWDPKTRRAFDSDAKFFEFISGQYSKGDVSNMISMAISKQNGGGKAA
jgi:ATP-dependent helicase IRC3